MVIRFRMGMITSKISTERVKISGNGTLRARGEMKSRAAFCNSVLNAKDVISTAVTDLVRTGLNATNSVNTPVAIAIRIATKAITNQGKGVPLNRYRV